MSLLDEISDELRSKLNALQEAWDASPWAKDKQMCFPVENWLLTIIAAFSTCGQNTPEPWMSDEYWKSRLLQESDILYGHTAGEDTKNMRKSPGLSAPIVATIPPLVFFQYIKNEDGSFVCENDWYKVQYGNKEGYVREDIIIRDYSPVCCGIVNADTPLLAQATAMLNSQTNSHKVFNRIHLYPGDPNFSVGFPHLASDNERKLFLAIRADKTASDDFCKYIVYRLMNDSNNEPSYKWQAANEDVIRNFLFSVSGVVQGNEISKITVTQWVDAIKLFFSEAGVLSKVKRKGPLSGKWQTGLSYWAEMKSKTLAGCANADSTSAQSQKNSDCKNFSLQTYQYQVKEGKEEKKITEMGAKLFQNDGDDPNTYLSGFWFHDIVKDALRLKSVAAVQIQYWKDKYYKQASEKMKEFFPGVEASDNNEAWKAGFLCMISWANSGGIDKLKFSCNISDQNTSLKLVGPKNIKFERVCENTALTDTKILLLWLAYNEYHRITHKEKPNYLRSRMMIIWNRYMRDKWQLRDGLEYPIKTTDITGYTGDKGKV